MAQVMSFAVLDGQTTRLPVTVILPAHNAAATLARAVELVLLQTRPPAEVIIIDDASTDSTAQVIQALCAQHPAEPIRALRLAENVGPGSARNAGWEAATQGYVAFLDADDAWHPRKLEIQHRWLADNPGVVLCGHRCLVIADEKFVPELPTEAPPVREFGVLGFLLANRLSTPTVMLRRELPQRFVSGKRYSEDYLLWIEIVAAHGPAAFIDLPLAFLFKARYGAKGLSAEHWRMRQGEIDTLARLRQQRIISPVTWLIFSALGWAKFVRRTIGLLGRRS